MSLHKNKEQEDALDRSLDVNQYAGPDLESGKDVLYPIEDEFDGDHWDNEEDYEDADEELPEEYKEDEFDDSQFLLTDFYSELSLKHNLIEVTGSVKTLETDGKKYQVSDFKFATKYVGKHDYFRIIFNHDTKLCHIHTQIKTKVISKYDMKQADVMLYIYNEL